MSHKSRETRPLPCGGSVTTAYYQSEGNPVKFITYRNANNQHHRVDGPASYWYCRTTGRLEAIEYWQNGRLHRDDGPAIIEFHTTDDHGNDLGLDLHLMLEEWYQNHRTTRSGYLPASIEYARDGRTVTKKVYFKGSREIKESDLPEDFHQLDPELKEFTWELL